MTAAYGAPDPLTICIIAGEASGDRLGAAMMRALKSTQRPLRLIGVGGGEMSGAGLQSLVPAQHIAFIGFGLVTHLPAIFRYIREVSEAVVAARPDVLVIIDSPDLTHRIARRVRKQAPSIPIVDYVSPSVWAWRPGRARAMRSYVEHVLALLPFEPQVHARLGGPPCSYVGHPLIEQLNELRPNADEAARRRADPPVLLVLPGSRAGEIRRMTAVFGDAIALLRDRIGAFEVVVPTVPQLKDSVLAATAHWNVQPRVVVDPAEKWAAFRVARAALAKSGTVTLELALSGVPMVAAYKVSLFDETDRADCDQRTIRHSRQSGHWGERRTGTLAAGLHAEKPGRRARALVLGQPRAPPPGRGLRPARTRSWKRVPHLRAGGLRRSFFPTRRNRRADALLPP